MQEYASLFIANVEDKESILPLRLIFNGRRLQTSIMEHKPGRMYLDISHVVVHTRNASRRLDHCARMEFYEVFYVCTATLLCLRVQNEIN